jgi:tRNA threonylcarbamoyladenosine biosynthesis protein TsaE
MSETTFTTTNAEETMAFAEQFAQTIEPGTVILLSGDLGAGKTTFTKGFARGLGITADITSPTFTLMNLYELPNKRQGITKLVHMDAYRLESTAEYIALGAEDYIGAADTVSIVEWAEKIPLLAQYNPIVRITISTKQQTERNIVVER